jgi:hypothetical protein
MPVTVLFVCVVTFLKAAVDVAREEHPHALREPLIAWVLEDAAIQLLHDALSPLDRR